MITVDASGGQGDSGDTCTETECKPTTDSETDPARVTKVEGGAGNETEGSDTGTDWTTNNDEEDMGQDYVTDDDFLAVVQKKAWSTSISKWTEGEIMKEERNNSFRKVTVDRRGRCTPRLVCCSDDVFITMNTGTGEKDLHIIERESGGFGQGDCLLRNTRGWPDIDRDGEYREEIKEMTHDLTMTMHQVRNIVSIRKKVRLSAFETGK